MSLDTGNTAGIAGEPDGASPGNVGTDTPPGNGTTVKRGRGRPKKSADTGAGPTSINPADFGTGSDSEPGSGGSTSGGAERKRGRPRKEKEAPISVEAFIVALSAAQLSLVALTSIPECAIGEASTRALAEATANVARHYPVVMTQKQQDIGVLIYTVGSIGFTQFALYGMRKAKEAAEKKRREEMNTVDLQPNTVN